MILFLVGFVVGFYVCLFLMTGFLLKRGLINDKGKVLDLSDAEHIVISYKTEKPKPYDNNPFPRIKMTIIDKSKEQ